MKRDQAGAIVTARVPHGALEKIDAASTLRRVTRSTYVREATLRQVERDLRAALEDQGQG